MSSSRHFPDANVRSHSYYVARTSVRCPDCGLSTGLLALAMPQGHETLHADAHDGSGIDSDVDELCGESAQDVWQRADLNAFLFYVEGLPGVVQEHLRQLSQFFRPAYDAGAMNTYWANHCEHCGVLLGDHELHCEPEGAFMASSEAEAAHIQLLHIAEPFAAAAVGYACEPEFFASMRAE
jgi:hypothetical protein